jgi:Ca2+-binding RTX toxin-like protein
MVRRRLFPPLLLAALVLWVAAPSRAQAATVGLDGTTFRVAAAPGEANDLTVTAGATAIDVAFPVTGALTTTTGYCHLRTTKIMRCARGTAMAFDLGDGNDRLVVSGAPAPPVTVMDGPGDDVVTGGSGNDTFVDGPGADVIGGGGGIDTVDYSARVAPVTIAVGAASDGEAGENDTLAADVEQLRGGAGDDTLDGGTTATKLSGGDGADRLTVAAAGASLDGGAGDDQLLASAASRAVTLDGGNGNDLLRGGAAGDKLTGGAGADQLDGAAGDDAIDAGDGADTITAGDGNDTVEAGGGGDVVSAGPGNDTVTGGDGADQLDGAAGDDALSGGDGNDVLTAGDGNDALAGDGGADRLDAGAGGDRLDGGDGGDALTAGDGNDTLEANDRGGDEHVDCGPGEDTLLIDPANAQGG